MKNRKGTYELELKETLYLIVEVVGCYYPEEKMVMYYRDGSGYPGSPAYVELEEINVLSVTGDFGTVNRNAKNEDWFKLLDKAAEDHYDYLAESLMDTYE